MNDTVLEDHAYVNSSHCKACRAAYCRKRVVTGTRIISELHEYVNSNHCKACNAKAASIRQKNNRAAANKRNQEYYQRNIEARREARKARLQIPKNAEKQRAAIKKWTLANPDKTRLYAMARIARKRGAFGSHTLDEWRAVLKKHNNRCAYCRTSKNITKDHIVPLSCGGSDLAVNLQPLCRSCNGRKCARIASGTQFSIFDKVAI